MPKAELFDIEKKKDDVRKSEMAMSPEERLILVLDLMDLSIALGQNKNHITQSKDDIDWIELRYKVK